MTTGVVGLSEESANGRQALAEARRLLAEGAFESARRWATRVVDLTDELAVWSGTASVLRRIEPHAVPLTRSARIAVLGSSTTTQLSSLLPLACARAGLQAQMYECAYGQYRQEVLDPDSALYAFAPDMVVLALHAGDVDLPPMSSDPDAGLAAVSADWRELWQLIVERSGAHVAQFTIAVPPERPLGHLTTRVPGARHRLLGALNLQLALSAPASVSLVDVAQLAATMGTRTWFDARYWHLARQAVSPQCVPALARQTGAVLAAAAGLSRKCLVLDLDGTLWGGVLGEDGVEGIELGHGPAGEAYSAFQEYVLAVKAKGVVLAVCSKNDPSLVEQAFRQHPGMRLSLDDMALVAAGWRDKATAVRSIADDLGLGLDALVFADDNPVEREIVRQLVPEVDVLRLPPDPAGYVRTLADYPYFETTSLTDEDARRTSQYRARAAASVARTSTRSLAEFLDSLDMVATIEEPDMVAMPRVAQLVAKTNQFNLTGRRRGQAELQQLVAQEDTVLLAARLADRFDDHGLVAVLMARQDGVELEIDTWLMSCRVIGRTLEHSLLAALAAVAAGRGCVRLLGTYVPSAKNGLVSDLYPRFGFKSVSIRADGSSTWTCDVADIPQHPRHIRVVGDPTRPAKGVP